MSKVWLLLLLSAIATLLFTHPSAAINAMIAGSHDAVALAINLLALYAFWLGFFAIIEKIGLADFLARLLRPVVRFLFPNINPTGAKFVTMNISANILGLGNASTPMAIRAIGQMDSADGRAGDNMIMMVVISATSLQLLPTTVIGLRATHGSANPADFLLPALAATVISTVLGITLVKIRAWIKRKYRAKKGIKDTPVNTTALPLAAVQNRAVLRK